MSLSTSDPQANRVIIPEVLGLMIHSTSKFHTAGLSICPASPKILSDKNLTGISEEPSVSKIGKTAEKFRPAGTARNCAQSLHE